MLVWPRKLWLSLATVPRLSINPCNARSKSTAYSRSTFDLSCTKYCVQGFKQFEGSIGDVSMLRISQGYVTATSMTDSAISICLQNVPLRINRLNSHRRPLALYWIAETPERQRGPDSKARLDRQELDQFWPVWPP